MFEYDTQYYKELFLRAQRAYAGQHMKAIYQDNSQSQFFNVENLALKYYGQREGWNGLHVENTLMKHYFGIIFWEEIFDDSIPFVFQTPYQFGPLDFNQPEFYDVRQEKIDGKLNMLALMDPPKLKAYFEDQYDKHKNLHNPLVNWDNLKLTKQRMATIAGCMGARVLCMFLSRLVKDYKQWSFGMPDLILWRVDKKRPSHGQIKFVEVKSEFDTLSDNQKCWIAFITQVQVQVDLCKITDKVDGVDIF